MQLCDELIISVTWYQKMQDFTPLLELIWCTLRGEIKPCRVRLLYRLTEETEALCDWKVYIISGVLENVPWAIRSLRLMSQRLERCWWLHLIGRPP
jgi:hypothetical protein